MNPIASVPGIDGAHPSEILLAFERASARAEVAMERWRPSGTFTQQEQFLLKRLERKRRLFGFLRKHRHEIFDDAFQAELESMYRGTGAGKEPVPPALTGSLSPPGPGSPRRRRATPCRGARSVRTFR